MTDLLKPLRLSHEQERFYYLSRINPANPEIYVTGVLRLTGQLDFPSLEASWARIIARHELLRATLVTVDERPLLKINTLSNTEIRTIDLSLLNDVEKQRRIERIIEDETQVVEPCDLESGPLFRIQRVKATEEDNLILLRFHHLICDMESLILVAKELLSDYEARRSGKNLDTPQVPAQYRAFLAWEEEQSASEEMEAQRDYWRAKLKNIAALEFPLSKPRPKVHTGNGCLVRTAFSESETADITRVSSERGVTPYVFLLASLFILLRKFSGQADFTIGTGLAARNQKDFEKMIGVLIHWLVFRAQASDSQSFDDFLGTVMADALDSYENQTVPLKTLMTLSEGLKRDPSRNPLFQVFFEYVPVPEMPQPPGLAVKLDLIPWQQTHFDLAVLIEQKNSRMDLAFNFYRELVDPETANELAQAYLELVRHYLKNGSEKIDVWRLPAKLTKDSRTSSEPSASLNISATFTAEPVEPSLAFWCEKVRLPMAFHFSGLNQIFQDLLDPTSSFSTNQNGVNAILLRFEDWKDPISATAEFIKNLKIHAKLAKVPLIVVTCPASPAWSKLPGHSELFTQLEGQLANGILDGGGTALHLVRASELLANYPVSEIHDPESEAYGKVPYTSEFYTALGTQLCRKAYSLLRAGPKVLVLDCDNTLWKGVIGEDGVRGLSIGPGHRSLQEFAVKQYHAGVLLCLCSKNNEADVWEAFEQHPDMILKREQISAYRINWEAKSGNLLALARELNLGEDSLVFMDDSRLECAEVTEHRPGIQVVQIPLDGALIPGILDHLWAFDPRVLTATDLKRNEMYVQNAKRERIRDASHGLKEFIASLELKLNVAPLTSENAGRVAQMTQRTNQFNATTLRRTETEILALSREPGTGFLVVDVSDRFGDYGVVGLVIYRTRARTETQAGALTVDTFLLSCRALGRGVEQRILKTLGDLAHQAGLSSVDIPFQVTAKNAPAHLFLEGIAREFCKTLEPGLSYIYEIPVQAAQNAEQSELVVQAPEEPREETAKAAAKTPTIPSLTSAQWQDIVALSSDLSRLETQLRAAFLRARPQVPGSYLAPRTPLETDLAKIWQDVLVIDRIGVLDNFFALGGDSIRSLQISSRAKKLGIAVNPLDIQMHPTIAELAELADLLPAATPTPALQTFGKSPQAGLQIPLHTEPQLALDHYPLSFNQEYLIETYNQENRGRSGKPSGAYHFQHVTRFTDASGIQVATVEKALALLVRRHPALRSHVEKGATGCPAIQVVKTEGRVPPTLVDLSGFSSEEQDLQLQRKLEEDRGRPFDVSHPAGGAVRFQLLIRSATSLDFIFSAHHGFCDGWGYQAFLNDLSDLYNAIRFDDSAFLSRFESEIQGAPNSVRELVQLERRAIQAPEASTFWNRYLHEARGTASSTNAPLRKAFHPDEESPTELSVELDARRMHAATAFSKRAGVSLKAVFLCVFANRIAAESQLTEPLVALVTNGRSEELSDPLKAFGLFWNFLPFRVGAYAGATRQAQPIQTAQAIQRDLLQIEKNSRFSLKALLRSPDIANSQQKAVISGSFNFVNFQDSGQRSGKSILERANVCRFHRFHFPLHMDVLLLPGIAAPELSMSWNPKQHNRSEIRAFLDAYLQELGDLEATSMAA